MRQPPLTSMGATALLVLLLAAAPAFASAPVARTSATCSDYSNQAAAQRGADTRDADGDGIYCESLPCPCSRGGGSGGSGDSDRADERRRAAERRAAARRKAARRRAAQRRAAQRRAARREEVRRKAVEKRSWVVYDVVDGDTIKVRSGSRRETVRLIGVDSPETRKPGTEVECAGP